MKDKAPKMTMFQYRRIDPGLAWCDEQIHTEVDEPQTKWDQE